MNYAQRKVARRLAVSAAIVGTAYALTWASVLGFAADNLDATRRVVVLNYELTPVQKLVTNGYFTIQGSWLDMLGGSALLFAAAFPLALFLAWRSRLPKRVFASLTAASLVATFAFAAPLYLGKFGLGWGAGWAGARNRISDGMLEMFVGTRTWSLAGWVPHGWTGFANRMPHWEESEHVTGRKLVTDTLEWMPVSFQRNDFAGWVAAVGPWLAVGALVSVTVALLAFGVTGARPLSRSRAAKPAAAVPTEG